MEPVSIMDLITNVGFPIALVIYLLKRDKSRDQETIQREIRLGERIDKVEDDRRNDLTGAVAAATDAINNSTRVSSEVIKVSRNLYTCVATLTTVIQNAPCTSGSQQSVDPDIYAAVSPHYQRVRTPRNYEPHPSSVSTADPGEPPRTPEPIRRPKHNGEEEDTRIL